MADMSLTDVAKDFDAVFHRVAGKERVTIRHNGTIIGSIIPAEDYAFLRSVREDQERYWGPDWTVREHEVDAEYAAGAYHTCDSGEEFLAALKAID